MEIFDERTMLDFVFTVGAYVALTGVFNSVRIDPEPGFEQDAHRHLREIALAGYVFHNAALATFDAEAIACRHVRLSPRERE